MFPEPSKTAARTVSGSNKQVSYLYDAVGVKLNKTVSVNNVVTDVQDYLPGGIEYMQNAAIPTKRIERISTEEGYLQNSNVTFSYH